MRYSVLIFPILLVACNSPPAASPPPSDGAALTKAIASPSANVPPTVPSSEIPTSAPSLVPEAEKGEKGARNVLLEWARSLEQRDFARADAQWGAGAGNAKSGAQFAKYRAITVSLGEGTMDGGAGSVYYEVPVTLTLAEANGSSTKRTGTVMLRRANDVDGATLQQLRWHLAGLNLES